MKGKAILIAIIALAAPGHAQAHAALIKSAPGNRSVLTEAPKTINLCFNEAVELKFSKILLEDPKGDAVPLGALEAGEPNCLKAAIPALGSGLFTVHYHVLSRDGHIVDYGYQFTINPDAKTQ
jgi:methionine-rich copper-binding protein CopC